MAQRDGVTPDEAFARMRAQARTERRLLADVAAEVLGEREG